MNDDEASTLIGRLFAASSDRDRIEALEAMAAKPVTAPGLVAAARLLRPSIAPLAAPPSAIDVCGTGGDGRHSLNISTAVAFVVAAAGVPVAKHGNRAASSRSGAADVLEAVGVRIDLPPEASAAQLRETGFAFLFAPAYYPALAGIAAARRQLGKRTLFNGLGPLLNPARVKRQVIGVYDRDLMQPMADAFIALGGETCAIVHAEGMDELDPSTTGEILWRQHDTQRRETITPTSLGLDAYPDGALRGGDATFNAAALLRLLNGDSSAYRNAVVLNGAVALMLAGRATDIGGGCAMAASMIDNGEARRVFEAAKAFEP